MMLSLLGVVSKNEASFFASPEKLEIPASALGEAEVYEARL